MKRVAGDGFGKIARAPAADGQHHLQPRVVQALADDSVQACRVNLGRQVHAAIGRDHGEGEVHNVQRGPPLR